MSRLPHSSSRGASQAARGPQSFRHLSTVIGGHKRGRVSRGYGGRSAGAYADSNSTRTDGAVASTAWGCGMAGNCSRNHPRIAYLFLKVREHFFYSALKDLVYTGDH